jgi:hypothetical protein
VILAGKYNDGISGLNIGIMNYKPMEVSPDEMNEIAQIKVLWDWWGAENADEMLDVLKQSYCVKFDFVSGSPGYVGDLFIVQGDALTGAPPVSLTRDARGALHIVEYERYGS